MQQEIQESSKHSLCVTLGLITTPGYSASYRILNRLLSLLKQSQSLFIVTTKRKSGFKHKTDFCHTVMMKREVNPFVIYYLKSEYVLGICLRIPCTPCLASLAHPHPS
jgi:hypothetical protein